MENLFHTAAVKNALLAATALAALAPATALADVVETSLSNTNFIPTITVDGNANGYNRILTQSLKYHIRVKTRKPENANELIKTKLRIEDTAITFEIGDNIYPITIPVKTLRNNGNANDRLSPIKLCNNELNRNQGAERETFRKTGVTITRNSAYWVGASAEWQMWRGSAGYFRDVYKRTWDAKYLYVPVRVECKPLVAPDPIPVTEPFSVNLRVTQQGNTCPKRTEVRALIKYSGPATAKFRFKVDGKLSELVEIKARRVDVRPSPGALPGSRDYFLVQRVKYYDLDPGQHRFRIEVRGGQKSEVRTVNITCPAFKVTNATLDYAQTGGATCPHQVWETAKFYTNRPGNVRYEIKREPGNHASIMLPRRGTVKSVRRDNKYYAVAQNYWKELGSTDTRMKAYATGTPVASKWTQLKVDCKDVSAEKRKPKLSLRIASMNVKRVGKDVCPTQLRLTGRFDVGQPFSGQSIFVGPSWLSRRTDIKFAKAGGRYITATYPINWSGDVGNNLSSGSNKPKRQTIVFKMNVSNVYNKLVSTTSKQIKITCRKPTPGPGTAGDLTVEPTPPSGASDTTPGGRIVEPSPPTPPSNPGPGRIVDPVQPDGQAGVPGASTDTKPATGQPTRGNPTGTSTGGQPTRANPDAGKRRLEDLRKKQAEQKRAAEYAAKRKAAVAAARKKAAAAAKKKAAAVAKKKAAAVAARKKAAAAKKKAAAAKKKAVAAKKKAVAAAKKRAAAKKKPKKKGKKKGKGFVAQ